MKHIAMNLQHENWEDDGGDHDPFVVAISDEDFDTLQARLNSAEYVICANEDTDDGVFLARICENVVTEFPVTIDDCVVVWTSF